MDEKIEPESFDVIIVGTGIPESIIAAACSVAGKSVLHLDVNNFYGCHWSTLSPLQFQTIPSPEIIGGTPYKDDEDAESILSSSEIEEGDFVKLKHEAVGAMPLITKLNCDKLSDDLNNHLWIDVSGPRLTYCNSEMIDVLLRSGCHNYLEFTAMDGMYLWQNQILKPVPSSRAHIFQNTELNLSEKRIVAKFFKHVSEFLEQSEKLDVSDPDLHEAQRKNEGQATGISALDLGSPFIDLLKHYKLPESFRQFVLYSIALIQEDQEEESSAVISTAEGMKLLMRYLSSIGRFSTSTFPFLYPLYGQAELVQAFCRLAAVKGAIYVLRRPISGYFLDRSSNKVTGVKTKCGQTLLTSKLVIGPQYQLSARKNNHLNQMARCVLVTDSSLVDGSNTILNVIPPRSVNESSPRRAIYCFQTGHSSKVAPKGRYIVQLSTQCSAGESASNIFDPILGAMFSFHVESSSGNGQPFNGGELNGGLQGNGSRVASEENENGETRGQLRKPTVLWRAQYHQDVTHVDLESDCLPSNLFLCPSPDNRLDYDSIIDITRQLFNKILPGVPFFPSEPPPSADDSSEP